VIRAELHGIGVTVTSLCPGPVHTEFIQVAARRGAKRDRTPEFVHVSAEEVARAGLDAIERNRPLVIPGLIMKLGMFRIMPLSIVRLASRLSAKRS
jgi:short-subunit dehydrogenase